MNKTFIGVDFGSDSVRAVLVSSAGDILGSHVHYYSRWSEGLYCDASKSIFRQHPLDYLEGIETALAGVLADADKSAVRGIAIDTTGSTPCAVDASGTPLALTPEFADDPDAMFLLWKDHSSQAEADHINSVCDSWNGTDYRMYEGGIYSSEWFWSKLLYVLRHNGKVRNAAASFVEHCDWITAELTGNTSPDSICRSRCAAGHKARWHSSWGGLPPEEVLTSIDPLLAGWRARLFTETSTADKPAGTLSEKWAAKLGLSTDVVIGGSGFDCHFGAVGAQITPCTMVKVMGTSTCDILVSGDVPHCIPGICGQVDGSVVPGLTGLEAGQSAFGDVYAWFKNLLGYAGKVSIAALEKDAASVPPGACGISALDWFNGRRTPFANNALRGAVLGLNLGATAPAVFRALVESTLFGSKAIIERFREEGVAVDSITATGGISQKSPFVMQMCADILNMPVKTAACDQTCALGGAMFAAVASGEFADIAEAMESMGQGFENCYTPDTETSAVYNKLFQKYLKAGSLLENSGLI